MNTNTLDIVTKSPIKPSLYFGEKTEAQRLYSALKKMGQQTDSATFVSPNAFERKKNQSPIGKAQSKIKSGMSWAILTLVALTVGMGGALITAGKRASLSESVAYHEAMQGDYQAFEATLRSALGGTKRDEGKLPKLFHTLMLRTAMTMGDHATDTLDGKTHKALAKTIKAFEGIRPQLRGSEIALDFVNWLVSDAKLPQNPSQRQINQAFQSFEPDFLTGFGELSHLSTSKRSELTQALKTQVKELGGKKPQYNKDLFQPIFTAYLGNKLNFTLKDYEKGLTADGMVELFQAYMKDSTNLPDLIGAQRKTYTEVGSEILSSVKYETTPGTYTMLTLLLLGMGIGGAAVGFVKRREILGLPAAKAELASALKIPHLFITNADTGDIKTQARLEQFNRESNEKAQLLSETLRQVYDDSTYPEVQKFLNEVFKNRDALPDAKWFKQQFMYKAVESLLAEQSEPDRREQKPVNQVDLIRPYYHEMMKASETGQFFISDVAEQQQALEQYTTNASHGISNEMHRVDRLYTEVMKLYTNRVFGLTLAGKAFEKAEKLYNEANQNLLTAGATSEAEPTNGIKKRQLTQASEQSEKAELEKNSASKRLDDAIRLFDVANKMLDEEIRPLLTYRRQLGEAFQDSAMVDDYEQIQRIRREADGKLADTLEQKRLELFIETETQKDTQRLNTLTKNYSST